MLSQNKLNEIGFRMDNTDGYSQGQLDSLNIELAERVVEFEPFSDEWHQAASWFSDEVARR